MRGKNWVCVKCVSVCFIGFISISIVNIEFIRMFIFYKVLIILYLNYFIV